MELNKKLIQEIRELVNNAGGPKYVASKCDGVNYETYHNVLRSLSSDFDTVQKMIDKAKEIIAEKNSTPVVTI